MEDHNKMRRAARQYCLYRFYILSLAMVACVVIFAIDSESRVVFFPMLLGISFSVLGSAWFARKSGATHNEFKELFRIQTRKKEYKRIHKKLILSFVLCEVISVLTFVIGMIIKAQYGNFITHLGALLIYLSAMGPMAIESLYMERNYRIK